MAWKLYGEIVTPLILYFFSNHWTAFLKGAPLLVTILTRLSYLHIISLNNHCLIVLVFSSLSTLDSIQDDNPHQLCMIYLHPLDGRLMYTVSVCSNV